MANRIAPFHVPKEAGDHARRVQPGRIREWAKPRKAMVQKSDIASIICFVVTYSPVETTTGDRGILTIGKSQEQ